MSFQVYMDWSWGYITCVAAVLVSLHWIANRGGRCSCGDIMAGYYWSLDRRLLEKCIPAASDSYHVSLDALVMTHFAYGGRNVLGATIVAFTIDSPNESFFLEVARCIRNSHGERERWIDIYKITKIVRALWLAERRVCMRVCKHGCGVNMFCFSRANHASTNLKKFSSSKLDKFTLFTHSFVGWNLENRYKEGVSIFLRLSWHFKREKSVFCKASFCKTRTDYACKTSWTRFCDW